MPTSEDAAEMFKSWLENNQKLREKTPIMVRAIESDFEELVSRLSDDQKDRESHLVDKNTLFRTLIATHDSKSFMELNADFLWFHLLIYVLVNMESRGVIERQEFYDYWKPILAGSEKASELDDFHRSYDESQAIWWYTKEAFIYMKLNDALRAQDVSKLLKYRFYIADLCSQLTKLYKKNGHVSLKSEYQLYRGQLMSTTELKQLANAGYVSFKSFLSASTARAVANQFISTSYTQATSGGTTGTDLEKIRFVISIERSLQDAKPFASIKDISIGGSNEKEILFMIGAIFKIEHPFKKDDDGITVVKLQLKTDNDPELTNLSEYLQKHISIYKKKYLTFEKISLHSLGHIMVDTGKWDSAQECFKKYLNESKDNLEKSAAYSGRKW
ncbi:unnamed protein product [Rotaria sordida]|uniref:NAD(P)(+)--arginine ADP-ribosyltransferase n=1 Tax=Rotaria sordida TaxID=392033 RepID=A0A819YJP0_9BILA|nr:unnamed protein product [Rotaria sordida]